MGFNERYRKELDKLNEETTQLVRDYWPFDAESFKYVAPLTKKFKNEPNYKGVSIEESYCSPKQTELIGL